MTLPEVFDNQDGGGTPIIPRPMSPEVFQSFSGAELMPKLNSAAESVGETLNSAASSVSSTAQNLWASATGKSADGTTSTPIINLSNIKTAASNSMTWFWVLVGALVVFFGYREFAGKGKGKRSSFSKPRASGSLLNINGRKS